MVEKLQIKAVYNDFVSSIDLTKEQKQILDMLIKKEKIVKIAMELGMSQRNVGYEIRKLKNLYNDYVFLQTWKTMLLL